MDRIKVYHDDEVFISLTGFLDDIPFRVSSDKAFTFASASGAVDRNNETLSLDGGGSGKNNLLGAVLGSGRRPSDVPVNKKVSKVEKR
ncbi:hypothetical protein QUF75_12695 [Desulfococcaceae bacterium HSG7]|nr:hypothetical protein [Desulfococcaceae bacterium HSG7]